MSKLLQLFWAGTLGLALFLVADMPGVTGVLLVSAQLVVFLVAGRRTAALLTGNVHDLLGFLASVGGLLVFVALLGGWLGLAAPLALLNGVGLSLLVLPLALPHRLRRCLDGC